MKRLRKDILIKKKMVEYISNEKIALSAFDHPFILNMDFAF